MYLRILPLRRAFCCRHLRAASGIALLPLPGWASPWLLFALFYAVFASPSQDTLSGLWGGCSFTFHTFHTFNSEICIAWGFTSQQISHGKRGLQGKYPTQWPLLLYKLLFKLSHLPLTWHIAYTWLWRRCFLRGFTKALDLLLRVYASSPSGVGAFLGISPEPSSVHICLPIWWMVFFVWTLWPLCMFLDNFYDV